MVGNRVVVLVGADISSTITSTIVKAIGYAKIQDQYFGDDHTLVQFGFNGIVVSVRSDSDPELIERDYLRAWDGCVDKNIGPYPNPVLTDEELANDAHIRAENERQEQQRQAEYEAKVAVKRQAIEAKLAGTPEMEIVNETIWQSGRDLNRDSDYGQAIYDYAERWARLMQIEVTAGRELEDVARPTADEANIDGITGFMYGAAVHILATCWVHGDRLRKWHNAQYGVSEDVSGTVNPAVLRVD